MKSAISLPKEIGLNELAQAFSEQLVTIFHKQLEAEEDYYFLGLTIAEHLEIREGNLRINQVLQPAQGDPLQQMEAYLKGQPLSLTAPLLNRAYGYFGYDVARFYEQLGEVPDDPLALPDVQFFRFQEALLFDPQKKRVTILQAQANQAREQEILTTLHQLGVSPPPHHSPLAFEPLMEAESYRQMVETAQTYIRAGDCFQVVPSQRFVAAFDQDALTYFLSLQTQNTARYQYYFKFPTVTVIGFSPETLVTVQDGLLRTNPIAGTRKRGQTSAEDQALAAELQRDPKELAEHQMLVDLGRNDVARVAEVGSVAVTRYLSIERFQHVMHLVSLVEGKLAANQTLMDVVKALLPAGTVSGAPKIRAMQRLYQWEPVKRTLYGGAIGYIDSSGQMDLAITIRTLIIQAEQAYVQAGAGVVHDSVPEKEYQETLAKAQLFMEVQK